MMEQYKTIKEMFFKYYGETLDLLGLTEDDLINAGQYISENVDAEQVADWIRRLDKIVHEYPELEEKYGPQIREYTEKMLDLVGGTIEFMIENRDMIDKIDMEQLAKVIVNINDMIKASPELYAKYEPIVRQYAESIYDVLEPLIDEIIEHKDEIMDAVSVGKIAEYADTVKKIYGITNDIVKSDSLEEALDKLEDIVVEKAGLISKDLYEQIRQIALMLSNQTEGKSLDEIMEELKPLFEQLKEIGLAAYNLPDYVKAMDAYTAILDQYAQENAELKDEVSGLQKRIAVLKAKSIDVEIASKTTVVDGKAVMTVSWEIDEDAAGYDLKVNGNSVNAAVNGSKCEYSQEVVLGDSYEVEVTPYIVFREEAVSGDSFKETVVPKVKVKKAKLKKVKPASKALTVIWKKVANADGYKVYYKKAGKKAQYKTVTGAKTLKKKLTKLDSKKKYTVKVRAWKTVNGKKVYGKWSKAKKIVVK